MSALGMFGELEIKFSSEQEEDEASILEAKKARKHREVRANHIRKMEKGLKHLEVKYFDFFVLAIKRRFDRQLKQVLREDHLSASVTFTDD